MDCPISLLIKSRLVTCRNALCVSVHTKHNNSKTPCAVEDGNQHLKGG